MDIVRVLTEKFSDIEWSMDIGDLSSLVIHKGKRPTDEELETAWQELLAEDAATEYKRKREAEFPGVKEMVVAMWEAEMEGNTQPMEALHAKRQAIKAKYPKPNKGS